MANSKTAQIAVLHIPHSSRHLPAEERQTILLDDAALNSELLRMTDASTDELFPLTPVEAARVIFPLSRLVCDVERFPSDEDEPMAVRGMAIYNRTSMGDVLRAQPDAVHRQAILDHWYWPHHVELERLVNDVVARSGNLSDCRLSQLRVSCAALRARSDLRARRYLRRYGLISYAFADPRCDCKGSEGGRVFGRR
jgi:N-formylglutamate amidohydrolase